jgi:hypothetical protein
MVNITFGRDREKIQSRLSTYFVISAFQMIDFCAVGLTPTVVGFYYWYFLSYR